MHTQKLMSTSFSEKETAITERDFGIVRVPRKQPESTVSAKSDNPLADYVLRVMRENNMTFPDVERVARRRGAKLGKSAVQQIATGKTTNPGIYTLQELAWGLGRPVEEVIAAALGSAESTGFEKSELVNLWEMSQQVSLGEQRFFKRCIQVLEGEMRRLLSRD